MRLKKIKDKNYTLRPFEFCQYRKSMFNKYFTLQFSLQLGLHSLVSHPLQFIAKFRHMNNSLGTSEILHALEGHGL